MPDRESSGQTEADSNRFESLMAARGAVNKSVDKRRMIEGQREGRAIRKDLAPIKVAERLTLSRSGRL